jgi:hypothetical protein
MPTQQGSLDLLNDPVAQQLLQSRVPARLAYTWTDGTPRVVPIGFHWTGEELVLGTFPDAPKMHALKDGAKVAVSIDSDTFPFKVLLIRGSVHLDAYEGVAPEYVSLVRRMLDEQAANAWLGNMQALVSEMALIHVRPEWVGILDFETRFPSALERAVERVQARA